MTNGSNRIADLKRIESLAEDLGEELNTGRFYEGKEHDRERVNQIKIKARIERLELELARQ